MKKGIIFGIALMLCVAFNTNAQVITMGGSAGAVVNTATAYNTQKVEGGYTSAAIQTVITKVSGTVGGTVTLQGSIDGTNYETVDLSYTVDSVATFTPTDVATNSVIFLMNGAQFAYYRIKYVGTGTMSATVTSYFSGKK